MPKVEPLLLPSSHKERAEQMRLARGLLKLEMKRQGLKVSDYAKKEITRAAIELLNSKDGPDIKRMANRNLIQGYKDYSKLIKV